MKSAKTLPRILASALCAGLLMLLPFAAQAHTELQESTPGDGAIIKAAPGHLDLVFNGLVKLIKFEVMGVGHEMPTKFEPQADAMANYRIETPGMHPGQFTVNWAVIGADGHTVTNTFSFNVDPNAEENAGHHGDADHGHDDHAEHGDAGHQH